MKENDTNLNWIFSSFQEAATLHTAIHSIILRYPDISNNLTPDQKIAKDYILTKAIEDLEKLRDAAIESAIHSYKVYKENNARTRS